MPEIGGVSGGGVTPQGQGSVGQPGETATAGQGSAQQAGSQPVAVQPGALGQPTGVPVPGQGQILPDVLAGRDASQLQAAERMREAGGASAIEKLLGLNQQPSVLGAFAAPPGNSEALRHMSPTMRRTIMRGLVEKQRLRLRRLARHLREEQDGSQQQSEGDEAHDGERLTLAEEFMLESVTLDAAQLARARSELTSAARMLDLLDELLVMQDCALSQMGAFAQG
ncbi:MAG TPA: hypothetical protein VGW12_15615 [Pyrinomonadaceae bacterium]|nr:hypothetical protein [Pyrinomonadaceae bacterium]